MIIYVFGNQDHPKDNLAFKISEKLSDIENVSFKSVSPNDDLPIPENKNLYILDTVMGIDEVTLLTEKDIDKLLLSPRTTTHDYDLGFQLKYLSKIGRLKKIFIIGLPINGKVDYDLTHSILRKLVAQDIQGS
jgi:hypothetical protein